jgi:hypothetical protein
MTRLRYILSLLLFIIATKSFGQREDVGNYEYDREYVIGINKNTNGGLIGGLMFKVGTRIDDTKFSFWGLEFANVKNPKEVRYNTVLGNRYVFGKSNYLYAIRPQIGRELILFKISIVAPNSVPC